MSVISPGGIGPGGGVGTPSLGSGISPAGIPEGPVGQPSLGGRVADLLLLPSAIASNLAIGHPTISNSGATTIHPTGIPPG